MSKFQVIVADPPFSFSDSLKMSDVKRGADSNYVTMTIQQIKDMKVKQIADSNGAILALWVPSSLLQEGLDIMKSWGFNHKQTYIWVKTKKDPFISLIKSAKHLSKDIFSMLSEFNMSNILNFGMGRLFRQTHEICLVGTNNNKIYKLLQNKSQRSVCFSKNVRHSAKPEDLQDSLDLMFNGCNKIELFARRQKNGWVCLGNEVCNGKDINESIEELI